MVDRSILKAVQDYLTAVREAGIHANQAILFGSFARGEARPDSDIDLAVIAPEFDGSRKRELTNLLWQLRAMTDSRIEPIAVGERQWREDDTSAIVEICRREGQPILYAGEPL